MHHRSIVTIIPLQKKCEKYWPEENDQEVFNDIKVSLKSEEIFPDYSNRHMIIEKDGELRSVRQFHFTTWPDHGVPMYATALLRFLRYVREYLDPDVGPTIVHCRYVHSYTVIPYNIYSVCT